MTEKDKFYDLLQSENLQHEKLHDIVIKAIEEEKLITNKLMEFEERETSFSERVADRVAAFGGSWQFIIVFVFFLIAWMTINILLLKKAFDPYPFILLNLFLSALAAVQAPVIMMSQNRKEEKDRRRAINDYLINLKAEIEIRNMHQKLDLLIAEQMKTLFDIQKVQVELMEDIKTVINKPAV
ncbi:DUF1003 domain-containing protein [Parafilimonas terrae]|uniref:Uncharacterized membrane protein n=1 Tax=Parafilimonas terrae TaxID=1465490 RepID=A0A1I5TCF6_9BACT|nr:DUF1003 domain-containing protein [Parafilimonas terrae]SFP80710.1 Uncharacterized membrane protein [Parafilimonas terrae]